MDTYKATNTTNGKFYIGSTTNFEKRKKAHLRSKEPYPFQNALRRNPEAFEWECWTDDCEDSVLEQALLDMWFGCGQCYNLNPSAKHPPRDTEGCKLGGKVAGEIAKERGQIQELAKRSGQGQKNVESGLMKRIAPLGAAALTKEQRSEMGKKGGVTQGKRNIESGLLDSIRTIEGSRKGGKTTGSMPYWTDGERNKRSHECPGEGWRRGMTKKKKNKEEG
jgi:hypothetical protein